MSFTLNLPIGQDAGGGDVYTDETLDATGIGIELREVDTAAVITGSHLGNGVYTFPLTIPGLYKVFSNGSELIKLGVMQIGEKGAVLITGTQSIAGVKTFTDIPVFDVGLSTDTITEETTDTGVTIDGVLIKDSLEVSGIVDKSSNQTSIAGNKGWTGVNTFAGGTILGTGSITVTGDMAFAAGKALTLDNAPTVPNDVIRLTDLDAWFPLGTSGSYGYIETWNAPFFRGESPKVANDVSLSLGQLVTNRYMRAYMASQISAVTITPTQIPGNVRYVIPLGAQETDRVYTTIALAYTNAITKIGFSDTTIDIILTGNGYNNGSLPSEYNYFNTQAMDEFINIGGTGRDVRILINDSAYVGGSPTNKSIFFDCTLDCNIDTSTPSFEDCIFKNVIFDGSVGAGATFTFNSCDFEDCEFTSGVTAFTVDSDCTGKVYNQANDKYITYYSGESYSDDTTVYDVITTAGDVKPKRLLGRNGGTIASDTIITLLEGNFFVISGTTLIEGITVTGWTEGSTVKLWFQDVLTIDEGALGGNITCSTGDITTANGMTVELTYYSSVWYVTSIL